MAGAAAGGSKIADDEFFDCQLLLRLPTVFRALALSTQGCVRSQQRAKNMIGIKARKF
ncbi:MAG: hypothetical protein ACR2MG_02010 [Pyrinomonadaceae bacterium]